MKKIPKTLRDFYFKFLCILMLPLLATSFFFFTNLVSSFRNLSYNNHYNEYLRIANEIDYKLNQFEGMAIQLSENEAILPYNIDQDIHSQKSVINQMQSFLYQSDVITDVLLINVSESYILTTKGTYSMENYESLYGVPLAEFSTSISEHSTYQSDFSVFLYSDEASESLIVYSNYPYGSPYPNGALLFLVDKDSLFNLGDINYSLYYNGFAITENFVIETTEPAQDSPEYFDVTTDNIRLVIENDYDITFNDYYSVRTQFIILQIGIGVCSLLLIYYFSNKQYSPIKALNEILTEFNLKSDGLTSSEHAEIYNAANSLKLLSERNKELYNEFEKEKSISKELWLNKLLYSRHQDIEDLYEHMSLYGLNFNKAFYVVSVFTSDDSLHNLENMKYDDSKLIDVIFCKDSFSRLVVIIGTNTGDKSKSYDIIRLILDNLRQHKPNIEAYCGSHVESIQHVNISYVQAISLIEGATSQNNKTIHIYSGSNSYFKMCFPKKEIEEMRIAISENDIESAKRILCVIISQMRSDIYDYQISKSTAYSIVNHILNAVSDLKENDTFVEDFYRYISELDQTGTKGEIVEFCEKISLNLNSISYTKNIETYDKDKIDRVVDYINTHCYEQNFFLGLVAEKFDISVNNLSQQLKRKLGITPAKYIAFCRIDRAKQLLSEGELSANTISIKCGFSDFSSFSRNFKSITSLTPTQYREVAKKQSLDTDV